MTHCWSKAPALVHLVCPVCAETWYFNPHGEKLDPEFQKQMLARDPIEWTCNQCQGKNQ